VNTPIGFIVSWSTPATVQLADLRAGLTLAGLKPDEFAPDLLPRSIVARTAGHVAKQGSTKDTKKLARPVATKIRQITREDGSGTGVTLTYTREAGIEYDDATGKLTTDDPALALTLDDSAKLIDSTRTASDVTRVLQRVVSGAGSDLIPVREQGGAYFIPAGSTVIGQMDVILDAIGGSLSSFACTIGHGTDESIANVITDYMLKQIGELKTAVAELHEKGIRADVKSRRITRVAELRDRVGAYATLVGTQASILTSAIDEAEELLLQKLGERIAQPELPLVAEPEPALL